MQSPVLERLVGGAVLLGLLLLLALVIGPREGARMPDEAGSGIPNAEAAPELLESGAAAFPGGPRTDAERVSPLEWGGPSPAPESETQQTASASQPPDRTMPDSSPDSDAPSTSPASPATAVASAPSGRWAVQIGSFSSRANADGLSEWCRKQGYGVTVVTAENSGRTWYRVRVGPYVSRDDARAAVAELALLGRSGGFVSDWENSSP